MQMHLLPHTFKRTQSELTPRVTADAYNRGLVFTVLGQMWNPHRDPDKLFRLRVVQKIYHISVFATLLCFLLLYFRAIIPLNLSSVRRPPL